MRWYVRLGSSTVAIIALTQANYASLLSYHDAAVRPYSWALALAIVTVVVAEIVLLRLVSSSRHYSVEREFICAAWLCIIFAVVLMLAEGVLAGLQIDVEFLFEEPLFGIGAMFALLEEQRLYNRQSRTIGLRP